MTLEEKELTRLIANGDDAAFEKLFKMYFKNLHGFALILLKDDAIAEDMVQQVFYKLWKSKKSIQIHTSLKSYLYSSVRYECLNYFKHQKVVASHQNAIGRQISQNDNGRADNKIIANELRKNIGAAIDSLPEQRRLVFQMSRFGNLKYHEISLELGISVKTVESHMGKALKQLRTILAAYLSIWVIFFLSNKFI